MIPYLSWSRQLANSDCIVSFNYDGVLNLLQEWAGRIRVLTAAIDSGQEQADWRADGS